MAISTLAGFRAGMLPAFAFDKQVAVASSVRWRSFWTDDGSPNTGALSTSIDGATCDNTTVGAVPFTNPDSGTVYLGYFANYWNSPVMVADRIWHNGGIDITAASSPQTVTSSTWGARDINGSTNGEGLFLDIEVGATVGAGTPTVTVGYTNSAGTASRSMTNSETTITASGKGTVYQTTFQSGDIGIRSVQSVALSATWTSGTINLVVYRPLIWFPSPTLHAQLGGPKVFDPVHGSRFALHNSSCLYFRGMASGTWSVGQNIAGQIAFAHG